MLVCRSVWQPAPFKLHHLSLSPLRPRLPSPEVSIEGPQVTRADSIVRVVSGEPFVSR